MAAAVGPDLRYVQVRQGDGASWLGKGTLKTALEGPFEVLEERPGADLVGWRYEGPFDDLPAVRDAFAKGTRDEPGTAYEHRVVPGARSARTRAPASSTSRPAAARRTSSSVTSSACR